MMLSLARYRVNIQKLPLMAAFIFSAYLVFSQQPPDTTARVYTIGQIEKAPEYPGGAAKMMTFIMANMAAPAGTGEAPPSAVAATFIVNEDGSVSRARITKSSHNAALDTSLLEAIYKMSAWKPGRHHNKPVKCYFNLPINCILYK